MTEDLHTALTKLRHATEERYLWVDAICINQNDVRERSEQVLRLRSIFARAEKVFVWLGKASFSSAVVISHLEALSEQFHGEQTLHGKIKKFYSSIPRLLRGFLEAIVRVIGEKIKTFLAVVLGGLVGTTLFGAGVLWALRVVYYWVYDGALIWIFFDILIKWQDIDARLQEGAAQKPETDMIIAMQDFFHRGWFTSLWSIQVLKAARSLIMVCGERTITGESMIGACARMHQIIMEDPKNAYTSTGFQRFQYLALIVKDLRVEEGPQHVYTQQNRELLHLMTAFSRYEAADPRDKIWALLGIANEVVSPDHELLGLSLERCIPPPSKLEDYRPDYSKRVDQVYIETAYHLITDMNRLDILRFCVGGARKRSGPSWTPNWTLPELARKPTPSSLIERYCSPFTLPSSPNLPISIFSSDMKELTLHGFIIGTLASEDLSTPHNDKTEGVIHGAISQIIKRLGVIFRIIFYPPYWLTASLISPLLPRSTYLFTLLRYLGVNAILGYIMRRDPWGIGFLFAIFQDSLIIWEKKGMGRRGYRYEDLEKMDEREEEVERKWWLDSKFRFLLRERKTIKIGEGVDVRRGDSFVMFVGGTRGFVVRKVEEEGEEEQDKWSLVGPATIGDVIQDYNGWWMAKKKFREGNIELKSFTLC